MNKILFVLLVLFLMGCTFLQPKSAAIEKETNPESQMEQIEGVLINLHDGTFDQPEITVKKGTKVTWKNLDDKPYWFTIYIYVKDEKDTGIENYQSGTLMQGDEFSYVFEQIGEHEIKGQKYAGLQGKVTVTE